MECLWIINVYLPAKRGPLPAHWLPANPYRVRGICSCTNCWVLIGPVVKNNNIPKPAHSSGQPAISADTIHYPPAFVFENGLRNRSKKGWYLTRRVKEEAIRLAISPKHECMKWVFWCNFLQDAHYLHIKKLTPTCILPY